MKDVKGDGQTKFVYLWRSHLKVQLFCTLITPQLVPVI